MRTITFSALALLANCVTLVGCATETAQQLPYYNEPGVRGESRPQSEPQQVVEEEAPFEGTRDPSGVRQPGKVAIASGAGIASSLTADAIYFYSVIDADGVTKLIRVNRTTRQNTVLAKGDLAPQLHATSDALYFGQGATVGAHAFTGLRKFDPSSKIVMPLTDFQLLPRTTVFDDVSVLDRAAYFLSNDTVMYVKNDGGTFDVAATVDVPLGPAEAAGKKLIRLASDVDNFFLLRQDGVVVQRARASSKTQVVLGLDTLGATFDARSLDLNLSMSAQIASDEKTLAVLVKGPSRQDAKQMVSAVYRCEKGEVATCARFGVGTYEGIAVHKNAVYTAMATGTSVDVIRTDGVSTPSVVGTLPYAGQQLYVDASGVYTMNSVDNRYALYGMTP